MVYEFECPYDGCDYTAQQNDMEEVVEMGQQHTRDRHGDTMERPEVEERIVGV